MIIVSSRTAFLESPIRDVVPFVEELERRGKSVINLNIGDPLKFDFDVPDHVKKALHEAVLSRYNYYSQSEGLYELREAICEKEKRVNGVDITPDDVIVTTGVSEGIMMLSMILLDPGDELLIPNPAYPPYISQIRLFGGKTVFYKTFEEDWSPDVDDIRSKISERTKGILLINPNNPTGAVYSEKRIREIADVAWEHNLLLISDEIYDQIVFDSEFKSAAMLVRDMPVVGLNGFSKTYLMTGWRLGYVYVSGDGRASEIKEALKRAARLRPCSPTPIQRAAITALRGGDAHIREMVRKLKERRDYSMRRIEEIEGISCSTPKGAFYLFPKVSAKGEWVDDKEFTMKLLTEEGVLVVAGSGFGLTGAGTYFRMVFLPMVETLSEVFDRIEAFLKRRA